MIRLMKSHDRKCLQEYLKASENLTINDENRLKTKVQVLEKDHTRLQTLEQRVAEMDEMYVWEYISTALGTPDKPK